MRLETTRGDGLLWIVTSPRHGRRHVTYLWPRRLAAAFPPPLRAMVVSPDEGAASAAHADFVAGVDAEVWARMTHPPALSGEPEDAGAGAE